MSAFCVYTCLHFRICICVVPNAWLVYDTLGLYDLFYLLIIFIYFLDLALPIIIYPICMLYIRTFGMQLCLLLALPLGAWSSLNYLYTYCKCIYKLHGLCDDHRLWSEWRWLSNAFQIIPPQGSDGTEQREWEFYTYQPCRGLHQFRLWIRWMPM